MQPENMRPSGTLASTTAWMCLHGVATSRVSSVDLAQLMAAPTGVALGNAALAALMASSSFSIVRNPLLAGWAACRAGRRKGWGGGGGGGSVGRVSV